MPEPRPAATVVLIRDGAGGLETLMLKRNKALLFAGGVW
ncbi:MAG: NUDIX hydrolase, partial [Gammaproteobacteria bacterium]|nr:NUDIX hydrolase [Gammaproteobacteria bacterium]